jgi:hypothetical protein
MTPTKRSQRDDESVETYETVYRGRTIRIERPRAARVTEGGLIPGRLYLDDEEIPVEQTEGGVIAHQDMAFKEYGSLEELAEDIIRQRGTAQITRGEEPHPEHHSADGH